jgi:diaminohydroxyphosphoribosylaminopyrimidine deaminase/5-amino-6-(5-phosphoribosylamino)uracil reductase
VGAIDPNPKVSGRGCEELRSAGVRVVMQPEPENIDELYEAFSKHVNTGTPFVSAKFAMSLDGKIATRTGHSKWVTGTESRRLVQEMRRERDAVLVGVNTVLADDPLLTVRDSQGTPSPRQPLRVVADSRCRTSPEAQLLRQPGKTLIACADTADPRKVRELEKAGAEVLPALPQPDGRADLGALLDELGRRGVVSLLAEGGGSVLGAMFDRGMVDKVYAFIAPVIVGGEDAASPVEGWGAATMDAAWRLERSRFQAIGPDWLIAGYPAAGS